MSEHRLWNVDPAIRASWVRARRLLAVTLGPDCEELVHSERVAGFCERIGLRMGLGREELHTLVVGSLLHDLGKTVVPRAVLKRNGPLSDQELDLVRLHPKAGADILRGFPGMERFAEIVLNHHERLDGSGYPRGLRGHEIDLLSRIAAVADVFDAITSPRPYRAAMPLPRALAVLRIEVDLGRLDAEVFRELADITNGQSPPELLFGYDAA
ncbi:MAG: HD-GYP domain-containing protein [Fimbriimonadales bacterium]|nr:HD-GYP domain-containing protein [Fimbriimonadales bacterium]